MTPAEFERLTGRNLVDVLAEIVGLKGRAVLDPEEAFATLSWGRTKGYEALRSGQLPSKKIAGKYIVPVPALLLWLLEVDAPCATEAPVVADASVSLTPTASNSTRSCLAE